MVQYFLADSRRVLTRPGRWIASVALNGVCVAIVLLITIYGTFGQWTSATYVSNATSGYLGMALVVCSGVLDLIFIFRDDFSAGAYKTAIGSGISRPRILLAKFLETGVFSMADIAICFALLLLVGQVAGVPLVLEQVASVNRFLFVQWTAVMGYMSFTLGLLYLTGSTGVGIGLFILWASQLVEMIVNFMFSLMSLDRFQLDRFQFQYHLNVFETYMKGGSFNFAAFVGMVIWAVLGFLLSCAIFHKKELPF